MTRQLVPVTFFNGSHVLRLVDKRYLIKDREETVNPTGFHYECLVHNEVSD